MLDGRLPEERCWPLFNWLGQDDYKALKSGFNAVNDSSVNDLGVDDWLVWRNSRALIVR